MGAQASQDLASLPLAADIMMLVRKMRVIPALPAECQVEAVRLLLRSVRWLLPGEVLLEAGENPDRLVVIVRGEAEAVLGRSSKIPILPEGAYFGEAGLLVERGGPREAAPRCRGDPAWALRRWRRLPGGVLDIVAGFLRGRTTGRRFWGRIRTTRRSLIATLGRQELLAAALRVQGKGGDALRVLCGLPACCNVLQNVTEFGAEAKVLGARDLAALTVVCEGPLQVSCRGALPAAGTFSGRTLASPFRACWGRQEVETAEFAVTS